MKEYLRHLTFLSVFVVAAHAVSIAQSERLDSLLTLLPTAKEDTGKIWLYEYIGDEYARFGYSGEAKEYYLKQKRLSEDIQYFTGVFRGTVGYCTILMWTGEYDSMLMYYEEIAPGVEASGDSLMMIKLTANLAQAHDSKGHFEIALDYFLKALNGFEKFNDLPNISRTYSSMQLIYDRLGLHEKAIDYGEKAVEMSRQIEDFSYNTYLTFLGDSYRLAKKYDKAEKAYLEVLELTGNEPDMFARSLSLLGLGQLYFETKEYRKAEQHLIESLEMFKMAGYSFGIAGAMYTLGQIEFQRKNFRKSEEWAAKALEVAERDMMYTDIYRCLHLLADIDIANEKYAEMFQKREKADSVYDIVVNDKVRQASEELSMKYETEKKNLLIQSLEEEKYLSKIITVISIILLLSVLTVSFFIVLWTKQKRKKAEIKIKQLEQEKQLVATQALLDGETQERTRLARDLHDGLGSILAAAKYNLTDIQKTPPMEQLINIELLDKAVHLLDESMSEMRRVAHHLMPESLTRYGLKQAIADFCKTIPSAKFVYYGDEIRLDPKMNVMIYRIMHELVSNALKHSSASNIFVQIVQESDRIAFTVQDNGCGFDASSESKGMGLENIRTRVAAYNGSLLIDSTAGKGTEINVELQLQVTN